MPVMSTIEQAFCRSAPWRRFTERVVVPWVLEDRELAGDALELGAGSGAMAADLLRRFPNARLVAVDVDEHMLVASRRRLSSYAGRAGVASADAAALPFAAGTFDAVLSFIMLHHVIRWEAALEESFRVLRPGGLLLGYDLVRSAPTSLLHRLDRSPHLLASGAELLACLQALGYETVTVRSALAGLVVRFSARRPAAWTET